MEAIYRTDGEWMAVYHKGHLFTVDAVWLGFVVGREVYDTGGEYLGFLSDDRRLLRKRTMTATPPRRKPPPRPERPEIPMVMPLSGLMRELPFHIIDVFEELEEKLQYISETRPDME